MNTNNLETTVRLALNLVKSCSSFGNNPDFLEITSLLRAGISECNQQNASQPLIISLIGGTGTGKSFIFSRLLGKESASPSSDSVRGFTRQLYVSAQANDRPFIDFGNDMIYCDGVVEGAVIIDTPDLDTIQKENAELTRKVIEKSDILVYVSTPDKRSNFDINQTIIEWASRKRWIFAMNKSDTAPDSSVEKLRDDFLKKISGFGFQSGKDDCFVFSARDQQNFEFIRFRDVIFSKRNLNQNRLIKEAACLRNFIHAFEQSEAQRNLKNLVKTAELQLQNLNKRMEQAPAEIMVHEHLDRLADEARIREVYQQLQQRRTLFMFPYIWVAGHAGSGFSSADVSIKITSALRNSQNLVACKNDEKRLLQDLRIEGETQEKTITEEEVFYARLVKENLQTSAQAVCEAKILTFYIFLANLLPVFILAQTLYRAFSGWLFATWLPSDFFVHAFFLISGSTLPGYLLLSRGISRISSAFSLNSLELGIKAEKLHEQTSLMFKYIQEADFFVEHCKKNLKVMENQIDNRSGLSIKS